MFANPPPKQRDLNFGSHWYGTNAPSVWVITTGPATICSLKKQRKLKDLSIPDILAHKRIHNGYLTEKPTDLEVLISQSTEEQEIILDPFMGSGSTGVASLTHGRSFIGSDICSPWKPQASACLNWGPLSRNFQPWACCPHSSICFPKIEEAVPDRASPKSEYPRPPGICPAHNKPGSHRSLRKSVHKEVCISRRHLNGQALAPAPRAAC